MGSFLSTTLNPIRAGLSKLTGTIRLQKDLRQIFARLQEALPD